ncbi:hypothetical protein JKP88DRAFT_277088 [Tribonema minus]|uniref:WSC domain-containing protein n=1 Tax=Tribonema minus TaxID=303371 RepID=A0A836CG56_9STRA|nr:hypothetical protein JKP88DRAFT_277088 [Tribonema minus]
MSDVPITLAAHGRWTSWQARVASPRGKPALATVTADVTLQNGGFEDPVDGNLNWQVTCTTVAERVTTGASSGGPAAPKSGAYMLRITAAAASSCSNVKASLSQAVTGMDADVPYHVKFYMWLPAGSKCASSTGSDLCPQLSFQSDVYKSAGTSVTAIAGAWNLVSGTIYATGAATSVTLLIDNLPVGEDVWIDDVAVQRCGLDDFRAYSRAETARVRERSVTINLGAPRARTGDGAAPPAVSDLRADVVMLRHAFPLGGAMRPSCPSEAGCLDFFREHFNYVVPEFGVKWHQQEPQSGVYNPLTDAMTAAVRHLGLGYRGHAVYWEVAAKQPAWLPDLAADGKEGSLQWAIWRRMKEFDLRYATIFDNYDVNNEMLHGNFFTSRLPCDTSVRDAKGVAASPCMCDYADACPDGMKLPKDVDIHTWMYSAMAYLIPGSRLHTNDYCMTEACGKSNALSSLVKQMLALPAATAMGSQAHVRTGKSICGFNLMDRFSHAVAAINGLPFDGSASREALAAAKRKMWITELDVQASDSDLNEEQRADGYETFYRAAFASPAVDGLLMWSWSDIQGQPSSSLANAAYKLVYLAGQRILGAAGLVHGEWNSTQMAQPLAAGAAAPNDDNASSEPTGESHLLFTALPGTYELRIAGCATAFTVPLGRGSAAFDVAAAGWRCADGGGAPVDAPARTGGAYVGCFDGANMNVANDLLADPTTPLTADNMTPSACVAHCASATSAYAALTGGDTCVCGAALRAADATVVDDARCSADCSGAAASYKCGAADAASVWAVAATTAVPKTLAPTPAPTRAPTRSPTARPTTLQPTAQVRTVRGRLQVDVRGLKVAAPNGGADDPNANGSALDPRADCRAQRQTHGSAECPADGGADDPNANGSAHDPQANCRANRQANRQAKRPADGGAEDPSANGSAHDPQADCRTYRQADRQAKRPANERADDSKAHDSKADDAAPDFKADDAAPNFKTDDAPSNHATAHFKKADFAETYHAKAHYASTKYATAHDCVTSESSSQRLAVTLLTAAAQQRPLVSQQLRKGAAEEATSARPRPSDRESDVPRASHHEQ